MAFLDPSPRPGQIAFALLLSGALATYPQRAQSQIIPDASLGAESSIVVPINTTTQLVEGGAIRGSSLFHSFLEFGVLDGTGVYFSDPASVSTIFSRITGSSPSNIFGTLGVLGDANLFLLNPNGIVLGPNAQLDMGGSLVISTADRLTLPSGEEFSATDPALPPLLDVQVAAPVGLLFENNTGVIANAGSLTLQEAQNLVLAGSAVVSAGNLEVPQGTVVAVTALGNGRDNPAQVNVSQAGDLLDVTSTVTGELASPALLASPQIAPLVGLTDETGQLQAGASNFSIASGDLSVQRVAAASTTLSAARNLILVDSQIGTQGDLNLLAQEVVQIRDSEAQPFIALAGGNLLVQGNGAVDIFALNNAESGLFSGADMVLRSAEDIGGDAHYWAGGNFRIEQLDGGLGNLFSPYDPVIRSQGDVSFFGYQGASLHILAGGSVEANTIVITGPDAVGDSINPVSTPELANVRLSDGTELVIDGSAQPTLDIRAGVAPEVIGEPLGTVGANFPLDNFLDISNNSLVSVPPPENNVTATSGNITIEDIVVDAIDGLILLTNQFEPNPSLDSGSITVRGEGLSGVGGIRNRESNTLGNSGDVIIDARGDLYILGNISTSSFNATGNAGDIRLLSEETILFDDFAIVASNSQGIGRGGDITIDGRQVVIQGGSQISARPLGEGPGGDINLTAIEDFTISGRSPDDQFSSGIFAEALGTGPAGNINLMASNLFVLDGTQISAGTISEGRGSSLTIKTSETIQLIGTTPGGASSGGLFTSTGGDGDAGELFIDTGRLIVRDGATITSGSFFGTGQGADININSDDFVLIEGSSPLSDFTSQIDSRAGSSSSAGDINITTQDLIIRNGGIISSSTQGEGDAGNLDFDLTGSLQVAGTGIDNLGMFSSVIISETRGSGRAGSINISARDIMLAESGAISAESASSGAGGNIVIDVQDFVEITGSASVNGTLMISTISSSANDDGAAGLVDISARDIFLQNGGGIFAISLGAGRGGNLNIASTGLVSLSGNAENGQVSAISTQAQSTGDAGDLNISTQRLTIEDGAQIRTTTLADGDGGQLNINATESIEISGVSTSTSGSQSRSGLSSSTSSNGDAGSITINVPEILIQSRAGITASTSGEGLSNSIIINGNSLSLSGGGSIETSSSSTSNAGNIVLRLRDSAILSDDQTGLFANTEIESSGNGGSIIFDLEMAVIDIQNGAQISVDSQGSGIGGSIQLQAETLRLNVNSSISASTASNNGGNIQLSVQDVLLLRNGSTIATNAGLESGAGNGGNIGIDAGFIIAFPAENSDITANAFEGNGGNVNITTQGLFGIEFRDQRTPFSDITASSEFGLAGNVQVDTLETDPTRALENLPEDIADTRIQETCQASGGGAVSFFDLGRGGIPTSPDSLLGDSSVVEAWTPLNEETSYQFEETGRGLELATSERSYEGRLVLACHF